MITEDQSSPGAGAATELEQRTKAPVGGRSEVERRKDKSGANALKAHTDLITCPPHLYKACAVSSLFISLRAMSDSSNSRSTADFSKVAKYPTATSPAVKTGKGHRKRRNIRKKVVEGREAEGVRIKNGMIQKYIEAFSYQWASVKAV